MAGCWGGGGLCRPGAEVVAPELKLAAQTDWRQCGAFPHHQLSGQVRVQCRWLRAFDMVQQDRLTIARNGWFTVVRRGTNQSASGTLS